MRRRLAVKWLTFKGELSIGDVLTSGSIIISAAGLIYSWHHDTALRAKEYADRIRRSTSVVAAKLDRWEELSDRYFEDIQPLFVAVSAQVAEKSSHLPAKGSGDAAIGLIRDEANRKLFEGLMKAKGDASQRVLNEEIQMAYMELYGYVPQLQTGFERALHEM